MTHEQRVDADARVRRAIGVRRKGLGDDAPPMPSLPGSPGAIKASTRLLIEDDLVMTRLFGFGEVWGRPALGLKLRSLLTVALLCSKRASDELAAHINNALNQGISPDEIHETLLHAGLYCGVPAWRRATWLARFVFGERGIPALTEPDTPVVETATEARGRRGAAVMNRLRLHEIVTEDETRPLTPLLGGRETAAGVNISMLQDIAAIHKSYAYGEVWSRPGLPLKTRNMLTIALLASLFLTDQLHAHINGALNLGTSPEEIHEILLHTAVYASFAARNTAANVARDVFIQRGILVA